MNGLNHIVPEVLAFALLSIIWIGSTAIAAPPSPSSQSGKQETETPKFTTLALRGRVVWVAEALARRHGIKTVPEAAERTLALETPDGQLIPLVEDIRGRSFRKDKRLRGIDLELLVRQYKGTPFVQVIQIFALKKDGKYELDYWCEICAIAMFELKACDCCQADIVLRERKVKTTQATGNR